MRADPRLEPEDLTVPDGKGCARGVLWGAGLSVPVWAFGVAVWQGWSPAALLAVAGLALTLGGMVVVGWSRP